MVIVTTSPAKPSSRVGLALGSGSARGWSHIGVIGALADRGVHPSVVCGTSVGALVGASYVSSRIQQLEAWACSLSRIETAKFFEISTSLNGFVNIERLHRFLNDYVASDDDRIESLPCRYAAVSTDLESGREIWFTKGSLVESVWASISLPGLFPAIRNDNRWLVDGGLVNPVPVSVCRALGAEIVIAVNLNGDIVGKHFQTARARAKQPARAPETLTDLVKEYTNALFAPLRDKNRPPNMFEAIAGSVNITQDRITRSRMAGDPPDILLSPKLAQIGLLEFYRASEAINEGRECVERMWPEIAHVLDGA